MNTKRNASFWPNIGQSTVLPDGHREAAPKAPSLGLDRLSATGRLCADRNIGDLNGQTEASVRYDHHDQSCGKATCLLPAGGIRMNPLATGATSMWACFSVVRKNTQSCWHLQWATFHWHLTDQNGDKTKNVKREWRLAHSFTDYHLNIKVTFQWLVSHAGASQRNRKYAKERAISVSRTCRTCLPHWRYPEWDVPLTI